MSVSIATPSAKPSEQGEEKKVVKKKKFVILEPVEFKEEWKTVSDIAFNYAAKMFPTWANCIEESRDELADIDTVLSGLGPYFPEPKNLFNALRTPLNKVRVIIIGQDPYPQTKSNGKPRAQGLSFSVTEDDDIPVSLKNIYKELQNSIEGFKMPKHGNLNYWTDQGVMLLNSCLTVEPGKADSHSKKNFWLGFISRILNAVQAVRSNVIVVMWGDKAQKIGKLLNGKAITLTAPHPSGFSAHRGFIGCGHFAKINEILTKLNEKPIDWSLP